MHRLFESPRGLGPALIGLGLIVLGAVSARAAVPAAGTKFLLLDDRVVDRVENVHLRVGVVTKHPANPLLREDRPWEVRFDNVYPNLAYDENAKLYQCWYSPFIVDELTSGTPAAQRRGAVKYHSTPTREMGVCYATSKDGLTWEKPALGVVEFGGNTANNLVLRSSHGSGVYRDDAEKDPARRFKLFAGQQIPGKKRGFQVGFSPDGIHWAPPLSCPEIGVEGDTHNNAFWAPALGKYVGITRRWLAGERLVMRAESADFTRWSAAVEVMRGDRQDQTYAMPAFAYGDVYLGLVMVLNTVTDRVQCELAWSPDTVLWHRIDAGHALIPNSPQAGAYDWGCVYAGTGPLVQGDEVRLYYGASNGPHTAWRDGFLALATLPVDRFAGYVADQGPGTILTRPVTLTGATLRVNLDASGGACVVEVVDLAGAPLPGFSAAEAVRISAVDAVRATARWANAPDLRALAGRAVRFKFHLTDAKVYAFEIQ